MVTIKDVARLAGVSPSTASRAMHDHETISQATKDRVRKVMEELNYSPNYSAQNLVKRRSNTIGVILPVRDSQESIENNPFFMQIIQGISAVCNDQGHMLALASGRTEEELQKTVQNMVRSGNISKFIFLYSKINDKVFDYVKKESVDCVVVGQSYEEKKSTAKYVDNDNRKAGYDATQFLIEKGYRKISYLYTDMDELVQAERYMGYADAMKAISQQAQTLNLSKIERTETLESIRQELESLESQAFVSCDDMLAVKIQKALKELEIGDTFAYISFNNSMLAQLATPSLTSVDVFPYQLGHKAAELVISEDKTKNNNLIIPHDIVERESTKRQIIK